MNSKPPQRGSAARIATSAVKGGCLLGAIGFTGGFVGPIIFAPEANQGPLLGILFTGPAGFVLGLLIGAAAGYAASRKNRNDV